MTDDTHPGPRRPERLEEPLSQAEIDELHKVPMSAGQGQRIIERLDLIAHLLRRLLGSKGGR